MISFVCVLAVPLAVKMACALALPVYVRRVCREAERRRQARELWLLATTVSEPPQSPEELGGGFSRLLAQVAGFSHVTILLLENQSNSIRYLGGYPSSQMPCVDFAERAMLACVDSIIAREDIIDSFDVPAHRGKLVSFLDRAQADWILPLAVQDCIIGWVLLGEKHAWLSIGSIKLARIRRLLSEFALTLFLTQRSVQSRSEVRLDRITAAGFNPRNTPATSAGKRRAQYLPAQLQWLLAEFADDSTLLVPPSRSLQSSVNDMN